MAFHADRSLRIPIFSSNPKTLPQMMVDLIAISKRIAELESVISPLQAELSKLRRQRANIQNGRKRLPKTARDANIVQAYECLTGQKITPLHVRACVDIGIKNPPINLSKGDAIQALSHAVDVCRDRISQIIMLSQKKVRKKTVKFNTDATISQIDVG